MSKHTPIMATPSLQQAASFFVKSRLLQCKRSMDDRTLARVQKYSCVEKPQSYSLLAEHRSTLWGEDNPLERDLTAGKVQNLRVAGKSINGRFVPAGEVFSFWKHVGKATKQRGFVLGRELREGCIVPTLGGGLCQLSNGLYDAALKAGFEIVERHAHTQVIEGSLAAIGRDATVFWNYVDFRFVAATDAYIEVSLNKDQLVIRFWGAAKAEVVDLDAEMSRPVESIGNCYSCNVTGCFRNKPQELESIRFGKTAALVDVYSPEFDRYLNDRLGEQDLFMSPINPDRFKAAAYRWNLTKKPRVMHATLVALKRALALRRIPKQGRALQQALLKYDALMARKYADQLDFSVSHVIVSQNLLPHLWKLGVLGGRTYDVLATRLPLKELQHRLDEAARDHPESPTLGDFRVDGDLIALEDTALAHANKVITPHSEIADLMGSQAELIDWVSPNANKVDEVGELKDVFFPASALGRKGIYEVVDALDGLGVTLHVLGRATEGEQCPLERLEWQHASLDKMRDCQLVVLPAYVEHSPRLLLSALAMGIPVIATKACGLTAQPGLTLIDHPSELINTIKKTFT